MPYITQDGRTITKAEAIACLTEEINSKGDLNYVVCELIGRLILKTKVGYTEISNWIDTLPDAEYELRRRLLDKYENKKIIENGDVPSFIKILKIINKPKDK